MAMNDDGPQYSNDLRPRSTHPIRALMLVLALAPVACHSDAGRSEPTPEPAAQVTAASAAPLAAPAATAEAPPDPAPFEAAKHGDTEALTRLLAGGADVNSVNAEGWTALMLAAHRGQRAAVELLIAKGADVKRGAPDDSALLRAAENGDAGVVSALVGAGADVNVKSPKGWTALMAAAWAGNADAVSALLAKAPPWTRSTSSGARPWKVPRGMAVSRS